MKMKATLLQGLLLVVVVRSQKSCRTHDDAFYSDIVEVEKYFSSSNSENYKCYEPITSNKFIENCDENIGYIYCTLTPLQKFPYPQVCKLSNNRNFLRDTVRVSTNTTCTFSKEICKKELFWPSHLCQNLSSVLGSHKNVWNNRQEKTILIHREHKSIPVIMENNITMYGYEPEKINDESSSLPTGITGIAGPGNLSETRFNLTPKSYTKPTKTWYIYKYPIFLTVHFCLRNVTDSCENHSSGASEQKNDTNLFLRWKKHFCELSSCNFENITFCKKKLKIQLKTNTVEQLPPDCKYTDGFCKHPKAFWEVSDICREVNQVTKYQTVCNKSKCSRETNESGYLTVEKGKLCDEDVWYTNEYGIVATDKELQLFRWNNRRNDPLLFYALSYSGETWGSKEYLIMIPLALAFFWYFLGIVVCFLYLCLKNRMRRLSSIAESFEINRVEDDETKYEIIRP